MCSPPRLKALHRTGFPQVLAWWQECCKHTFDKTECSWFKLVGRAEFRVLLERLPDRVWWVGPILWGPWGPWGHPPSLLTVQVDKRCMGTRWCRLEPRGSARHIIYAWRTGGEEGRQTIYDLVSPSSPPGRGRGQHICPKVCKTKNRPSFLVVDQ